MIKGIILHNFQSHSHTEIDFSKGINSITGQSNNGKTAIMRGFEDCRDNTSTGLEDVSHWAKKAKKNKAGETVYTLKDDSYVSVKFWDDIIVTRKRGYSPAFNGYVVTYPDGSKQIFDKIGRSGVPQEVQRVFNMAEVNVLNQYDAAFLVSKNGQDVARFFNRLVKLDDADKALAATKSRRNISRKEVKLLESEMKKLTEKITELSWTDYALMQGEKIQDLDDTIYQDQKTLGSLEDAIADIEYHEIRIQNTAYTEKVGLLLENLDGLDEFIEDKEKSIKTIEDLIYTIEKVSKQIKNIAWIEKASAEISKITAIDNSIFDLTETAENLEAMIGNIEANQIVINKANGAVKKYSAMLPEKCPTCDQVLKVGE